MELLMQKPETRKEDIIIVLLALQRQAFVLGNTIKTLLDKWPKPPTATDPATTSEGQSKSGILFVIKDSTSTSET